MQQHKVFLSRCFLSPTPCNRLPFSKIKQHSQYQRVPSSGAFESMPLNQIQQHSHIDNITFSLSLSDLSFSSATAPATITNAIVLLTMAGSNTSSNITDLLPPAPQPARWETSRSAVMPEILTKPARQKCYMNLEKWYKWFQKQ